MTEILYKIQSPHTAFPDYTFCTECTNVYTPIGIGVFETLIRFKIQKNLIQSLIKKLSSFFTQLEQTPNIDNDRIAFIRNIFSTIINLENRFEAFNYFKETILNENLSGSIEYFFKKIVVSESENLENLKNSKIFLRISEKLDILL
jgi:hypothetical protein